MEISNRTQMICIGSKELLGMIEARYPGSTTGWFVTPEKVFTSDFTGDGENLDDPIIVICLQDRPSE